jgi:hypothetical protein
MAALRGISFPFKKGSTGFPEPGTDDRLIKDSLTQLLLTGTGERVMRPTVGTNIRRFVFEPNDELLSSLIRAEVSSAIARFEPRVTLLAVDMFRQDANLVVTLSYVVNATQSVSTVSVRV